MIKHETLREFSLELTTKRNNKFIIQYGYDLSKSGSEYYVRASINGKAFNSDKSTLTKVRKLEIKPINDLIALIGSDETGISNISAVYSKKARLERIESLINTIKQLRRLYYTGTDVGIEHSVIRFEGYLRNVHYPDYYKRDMDLIRASKHRILA